MDLIFRIHPVFHQVRYVGKAEVEKVYGNSPLIRGATKESKLHGDKLSISYLHMNWWDKSKLCPILAFITHPIFQSFYL